MIAPDQHVNNFFSFHPGSAVSIVFSGAGPDLPESIYSAFSYAGMRYIQAEQVHGNQVALVNTTELSYPGVDALVTDQPDTVLLIRTADCVPMMIYDPQTQAIAAIHSGLRGTIGNIAAVTVGRLFEHFHSDPSDLQVFMGPSIAKCCYEVDSDVIEKIFHLPYLDQIVSPCENGKYWLDLPAFNRHLLLQAGVAVEHIHTVGLCTGCRSDLFYSYRKRKDSSRMYSCIVRKGSPHGPKS